MPRTDREPLVFGGAVRTKASWRFSTVGVRGSPCFRCVFPDMPDATGTGLLEAGILGPVTGVIGALQALAAVNMILLSGGTQTGRLLLFDGPGAGFMEISTRGVPAARPVGLEHRLDTRPRCVTVPERLDIDDDLVAHFEPALDGRGADARKQHHVRKPHERRRDVGLVGIDVEPGAGDMALREKVGKRLLVDDLAARRVDQIADGCISSSRSRSACGALQACAGSLPRRCRHGSASGRATL